MKRTLLPILIFISTWSLGQAELSINNPAPRVGDEIKISFSLKDLDERFGNGDLKLYETLTESGTINIGPFTFTIGGKVYESDVLTINVAPKLPEKVKDGLWVRLVEFKDSRYLIIEQRISNQWKKEKKSDSDFTISHGDGVTYTDFKREILENNGLKIISSSSSSSSQIIDDKDIFGAGTVSYKIQIFEFEKTDKFKQRVKIDKDAFINFPDKTKIDTIWIE
jgi:hypothetical protein